MLPRPRASSSGRRSIGQSPIPVIRAHARARPPVCTGTGFPGPHRAVWAAPRAARCRPMPLPASTRVQLTVIPKARSNLLGSGSQVRVLPGAPWEAVVIERARAFTLRHRLAVSTAFARFGSFARSATTFSGRVHEWTRSGRSQSGPSERLAVDRHRTRNQQLHARGRPGLDRRLDSARKPDGPVPTTAGPLGISPEAVRRSACYTRKRCGGRDRPYVVRRASCCVAMFVAGVAAADPLEPPIHRCAERILRSFEVARDVRTGAARPQSRLESPVRPLCEPRATQSIVVGLNLDPDARWGGPPNPERADPSKNFWFLFNVYDRYGIAHGIDMFFAREGEGEWSWLVRPLDSSPGRKPAGSRRWRCTRR